MQRLRYSKYFKVVIILVDIIVFALVFAFFFIRKNGYHISQEILEQNGATIVFLAIYWILLSGRTKLYNIPRNLTYTHYLERLVTHILIFIVGVILLAKVTNNGYIKQDRFLIAFALFIVLSFIKSIIFFTLKYIRTLGKNHRNVMFLGDDMSIEILKNILNKRKDYGYKIYEYTNQNNINLNELKEFWRVKGIHTLYLPSDHFLPKEIESDIFHEAELNKVKINLLPSIVQPEFFSYELDYVESLPILTPVKFPLDYNGNFLMKRVFDITFSAIILIFICSWLFPIISLLIAINSKGPVFFKQKRYGFHNDVFNCLKFRTMEINSESTSKTTEVNDSRITSIGRFLRMTSLDELPQFINVFLGDMSVVGPRPHMTIVDDYYKEKIGRYTVRSLVKPGITGLAQVSGLRGDNGDMNIEMKKRILADSYYVRNWSLVLDAIIILKTIMLVFRGDKNAF